MSAGDPPLDFGPASPGFHVPTGNTTFRCTCGDAFSFATGRPICPVHPPSTACAPPPTFQTFTATWPPTPQRLADEDVERIAKRVVELLREGSR